jgi:hypothetical protein
MSETTPWYERLTPEQSEWLFPRGQADIEAFLATIAEGEKHGIPAKCDDPETLLRIARIFAA